MPGPTTTLLIEGTFEELTDELAQYLDNLKKGQGDEASNVQETVAGLIQQDKKDDVLKQLVMGSQALNQAPEKGMEGFPSGEARQANVLSRVYSSIQPPHSPRTAVAQRGYVPPKNMQPPQRSHRVLTREWRRTSPLSPQHYLQHSRIVK